VSYYYENWIKYPAVFGLQKVSLSISTASNFNRGLIHWLFKDEAGTWVLSMPFPGSTQVPACSPGDAGVVVDTILRSGSKYHEKKVAIIADTSSQEDLVSIWAERKLIFHSLLISEADSTVLKMCKSRLPSKRLLQQNAKRIWYQMVFRSI
jgi:hypothetical protein